MERLERLYYINAPSCFSRPAARPLLRASEDCVMSRGFFYRSYFHCQLLTAAAAANLNG